MEYELAKHLKEVGFPMDWSLWDDHDPELLKTDWRLYKSAYSPTLSELIEAFGDKLGGIYRKHVYLESDGRWEAIELISNNSNFDQTGRSTGEGPTPEVALANLYLAIHAKT